MGETAAADPKTTRAWVLHPDIRNDATRRDPVRALDEAVALAAALPGLDVAGAEVVRLPRPHPGMLNSWAGRPL